MSRRVPALLALAMCGACELTSEPTADQRLVGIIDESVMVIAAPDTVAAGAPFDATITTIGMSSCWHEAGVQIDYATRLAVVTPYDLVRTRIDGSPRMCTGAIVTLPRTVRLVFGQTGVATLRVSGRKGTGGELSSATPATVEKQIIVR